MKLLCSKIEARKTFCGIYKAVLSLKKCKGGRSPQEKVSFGSGVCVWGGGDCRLLLSKCISGTMNLQKHVALWSAPSKASHLVFEIHEQTSRQELRDIFFHALEISTYKYLKVCILWVYTLLTIQKSKALVMFLQGYVRAACHIRLQQAALLQWEMWRHPGSGIIILFLSHNIQHSIHIHSKSALHWEAVVFLLRNIRQFH